MWAWLTDNPRSDVSEAIADGWCGVYGLPRVLWLGEDATLRLAPVPELEALRYNPRRSDDVTVVENTEVGQDSSRKSTVCTRCGRASPTPRVR